MKTPLTNRAFNLCLLLAFAPAFWPSAVQAQTCTASVTTASSPPAGGSTSGGGSVSCGSNVTVCATANSCYSFLYWALNGDVVSASNCYTFAPTSNETLVASFVNGQGTLATDNAADPAYTNFCCISYDGYATYIWPSGSNGGTGFGPWVLTQTSTNTSCVGMDVSSSTNSPPHLPPGIDTAGKSWFLFANNQNCSAPETATAYRGFASGSVPVGGQVLLDMDNGFNDVAGASVGFALRNGNMTNSATDYDVGARFRFFLGGGNTQYTVVDAGGVHNTGAPVTYTGLHLIFTLGANDGYTLKIITDGSGSTNIISGTLAGTPGSTLDSIALFNNDNGTNTPHDVFFNSLAVIYSTPPTYTINTSSSPAAGGNTSGGGTVDCGSNVTVCATPNSYYNFLSWTQNGTLVSTSACATVLVTSNESLVANFTNSTTDTVGDGIPDCWRQQYFGGSGTSTNSASCAACDPDGTGQNNLFKFVTGLNPTNPASVFVLNIASVTNQPAQQGMTFMPLASGRTYNPQFTTDLVHGVWSPLTSFVGPVTNGNQATITDTNAVWPDEFYRIDISLP